VTALRIQLHRNAPSVGLHHRVRFDDWLLWAVRDGFKLYAVEDVNWSELPIALLWRPL
jgi:hypothetical protein